MAAADYSGESFRYNEKGEYQPYPVRPLTHPYPLRPRGDAILGEHDLCVGLFKAYEVGVWMNGKEHDLTAFLDADQAKQYSDQTRHIMHVDMPGHHRLSLVWFDMEHIVRTGIEKQAYIYACLKMQGGVTWIGYSGYGVGKHFAEPGEEPEYMQYESEFSSKAVEESLKRIFRIQT